MKKNFQNKLDALKQTKEFQSLGAIDLIQKGNQVEMLIDASRTTNVVRKNLATGLTKAGAASNLYNTNLNPSFFEGPSSFQSLDTHQKIKLAMQYFNSDPLAGKIIEMMTTFANDGFKNEHADQKTKNIFDNWGRIVDIDLVLRWIFLEYFRSGNVPIWRELIPYKPGILEQKNHTPYWTEAAKKINWTKKMIPMAYTVLNPLTVYVDGVNAYKDVLYEDKNLVVDINSKSDMVKLNINKVPTNEYRKAIKEEDKKPLSEKNVARILRMRQPYEPYGCVLMERAFAALYEKNKLRQMDLTMVNSVINQIIKVTVGNDEHPATPKHVRAIAQSFQNAGKSQIIFWNHTLNIEVIRPDTKVLNKEKYERVNEDIRNAFGISEILVGGGGAKTNFATAYLSLKVFLANLIEARKDVERWLSDQYEDIGEVLQLDSVPEPSFNPLSLTDEIAEKQILMQLVDRGIVSYTTAQSRLGFDPAVELERKKMEKPLIKQGYLGFVGNPFQMEKIDEEVIDDKEEVDKNINIEDKKEADNTDEKVSQKNRKRKAGINPSVQIPKSGLEGRPKTPKGKSMPNRKTAKIRGQASEDDAQIDLVDYVQEIEKNQKEQEAALKVAADILRK